MASATDSLFASKQHAPKWFYQFPTPVCKFVWGSYPTKIASLVQHSLTCNFWAISELQCHVMKTRLHFVPQLPSLLQWQFSQSARLLLVTACTKYSFTDNLTLNFDTQKFPVSPYDKCGPTWNLSERALLYWSVLTFKRPARPNAKRTKANIPRNSFDIFRQIWNLLRFFR